MDTHVRGKTSQKIRLFRTKSKKRTSEMDMFTNQIMVQVFVPLA